MRDLSRTIRTVGHQIIDALSSAESIHKKFWERDKFDADEFYIVTVGNITEKLYPEIASCETQWEEWKRIFHIDDKTNLFGAEDNKLSLRINFLKNNPTLTIDTRNFDTNFTRKLITSFINIDEYIDGVMINSENWYGLKLLEKNYKLKIKCIYIDPPYNTSSIDFLYKDDYNNTSWITMMIDRLQIAKLLMSEDSLIFVSIDDNEVHNLRYIMDKIYGEENFISIIEWKARESVSNDALLSCSHNHILVYAKNKHILRLREKKFRLPIQSKRIKEFSNPDNDPRGPWKPEPLDAPGISPRPNLWYPIVNPETGCVYYPPDKRYWRFNKNKMNALIEEKRIIFGQSKQTRPMLKRYFYEIELSGQVVTTWWDDAGTTTDGTKLLKNILGVNVFNNPKPITLIQKICKLATGGNDYVLDFFAGSGTTGHAIIELNRQERTRRKFILIEKETYFDTILIPRIKKIIFTSKWRNGKPNFSVSEQEAEFSPRIIRVIQIAPDTIS